LLLLLLFHWNVELFELGAAGAVEKPEYYNIFQARDGEKALHHEIRSRDYQHHKHATNEGGIKD
jgi:hypothetical protein